MGDAVLPGDLVNAPGVAIEPGAILARMGEELRLAGRAARVAWPSLRESARRLPDRSFRSIVLTGCGDSYYAALSLRSLVEEAAGVPVLALPAMEAVAFPPLLVDNAALVIGISVSGKVERTIEAVAAHRARGGASGAISAFPDSDIASAVETVLATGMRGTPGPVPGTVNYLGSLLGIIAIAVELGERARRSLAWSDEVGATLETIDDAVFGGEHLAEVIAEEITAPICSLGSGPDLGTAWFGVAKFVEAAATFGVAQDLEEWAHEQYFTTGPGSTVFLHATSDRSVSRARRVGASVLKIGGRLLTIGPEPLGLPGERHWRTPLVLEPLRPLVAWVPMALAARSYALHAGRAPFGIDLPRRMETVDEDIYLADPSRR